MIYYDLMKAYFSFFSIMGIVLIAYTLLDIYSVQSAAGGEAENAQLLLDRMHFQRKDAEWTFWDSIEGKGLEGLETWEKAAERLGGSSWIGNFLDTQLAFVEYRNESAVAHGLEKENVEGFLEVGRTISMHSARQLRDPAIETVILNARPRAATAFVVRPGDYLERVG